MGSQLEEQMKKRTRTPVEDTDTMKGNFVRRVSTGSTLLDLAISGERIRGGGLPGGIMVEVFGPSGSGKTVLLCQIAGNIMKQEGQVMFRDPEARLEETFASMFGVTKSMMEYDTPDTVVQAFEPIKKWAPEPADKLHGVFIDSVAALSTDMEMGDGDKYGMRRAKEFSEACRVCCRHMAHKGFIVVCSNQIRDNIDAGPYGKKSVTPGGKAIPFYSSVRLEFSSPVKIVEKKTIHGKEVKRIIGVESQITVVKNSVSKPYGEAKISILFDYGIDDIRDCLTYLKTTNGTTKYMLGERDLGKSIKSAIATVEEENLEQELRDAVIDTWTEIENAFKTPRKGK